MLTKSLFMPIVVKLPEEVVLAFLIFYLPSFLSTLSSVLQLHIPQSHGNIGPVFYLLSEKTTRSLLILFF